MCGNFKCSKNTLIGLNIIYIVRIPWFLFIPSFYYSLIFTVCGLFANWRSRSG